MSDMFSLGWNELIEIEYIYIDKDARMHISFSLTNFANRFFKRLFLFSKQQNYHLAIIMGYIYFTVYRINPITRVVTSVMTLRIPFSKSKCR